MMYSLLSSMLFIIWTWGITPLWVNIVCTCLMGISMIGGLCSDEIN